MVQLYNSGGNAAASQMGNGPTAGQQTKQNEQKQPQQQPLSGPVQRLLGAVWSAFARRSQRKESDKTAIIQQHLRAIRHAENLDRQTHFRRSQGEFHPTHMHPAYSARRLLT